MKRHTQLPGIRKWAGNEMVELQSEPLKALDAIFCQYGPCILQGVEVTQNGGSYSVSEGLVVINGKDHTGNDRAMIVPFEGVEDTLLPIYLVLAYRVQERVYADEKVRPVTHDYFADYTTVAPEAGIPHIKLMPEGNLRFNDVLQDSDHRFITDAERADWNSKATGDHVHAAATTSKAGFMSAQDKQKVETANNDIADIKSGFITVGKAKTADSVAWANVTGKTDATTSASGLMSGTDKTNLGAAMTDIANLKSGDTAAGKAKVAESVAWDNVMDKVDATKDKPGLMTAADKTSLDTAVSNISDLISGDLYSGALGWLNPGKTDFVANHRVMAVRENASNAETRLYLQYGTTWSNSVSVYAADVAGKVAWEDVEDKVVATNQKDGLMSAADKSKLDGLGAGVKVVCAGGVIGSGSKVYNLGINFTVDYYPNTAFGRYIITHNLNTLNYIVTANAVSTSDDRMVMIQIKSTNQMTIAIKNGKDGFCQNDFNFIIVTA